MSIIQKKIITSLNVRNPINFCTDKKKHVYNELKKIYVEKCYAGCFIISIVSIDEISDCIISKTNISGEGIINVKFTINAIVFSHNDILIGVKIVHNQSMILGLYQLNSIKAVVSIPPTSRHLYSTALVKSIESLSLGQKIPIRIIDASHQPRQEEATIFGTLLVCDKEAPIYKINGLLNSSAKSDLLPLLNAIKEELQIRSEIQIDKINFFEKKLYSYFNHGTSNSTISSENFPDWNGTESNGNSTNINLLNFITKAISDKNGLSVTGYWSQSLSIYRSSPMIYFSDQAVGDALSGRAVGDALSGRADNSNIIEEGNNVSVFIRFLKNMLDFLLAIRQMTEIYNTEQEIKAHANIWAAMEMVQIKL